MSRQHELQKALKQIRNSKFKTNCRRYVGDETSSMEGETDAMLQANDLASMKVTSLKCYLCFPLYR